MIVFVILLDGISRCALLLFWNFECLPSTFFAFGVFLSAEFVILVSLNPADAFRYAVLLPFFNFVFLSFVLLGSSNESGVTPSSPSCLMKSLIYK